MAHSPMHWDHVVPDYTAWQAEAVQKSRAIQENSESLHGLRQHHTNAAAQDPCNTERFTFASVDRGVDDIQNLESMANDCQSSMRIQAQAAIATIDAWFADFQALELQGLASDLVHERSVATEKVNQASELLGQIVATDGNRRKGRDEVLVAAFGAGVTQNSPDEAKNKMYKQVRNDRIDQRMHTTISVAQRLYDDRNWQEKLIEAKCIASSILEQNSTAHESHSQARALETNAEVQAIVHDLTHAKHVGEQQLENCRIEKRRAVQKLDEKRRALASALQQVKIADMEYNDSYIENESLRLQVGTLESSIRDMDTRIQFAETASRTAVTACEQWHQSVVACELRMRNHIEERSLACKSAMRVPQEAANFNVGLALQLMNNVDSDNDLQIGSIETDLNTKAEAEINLQRQMDLEEPDEDIDVVESILAKLIDEKQCLRGRLTKATGTKEQLQTCKRHAQEKLRILHEIGDHEGVHERVQTEAHNLANSTYQNLKLWVKGKTRVSVSAQPVLPSGYQPGVSSASSWDAGPSLTSNATSLVAIDPAMQAWIEQTIDKKTTEKAQEKFEQMRADLLFRNAPSAVAASEISDDWEVAGDVDMHN